MGWFDEKALKRLLGIPSRKRVLLAVALGYSKQPLRDKQRRPVEEVASYNEY